MTRHRPKNQPTPHPPGESRAAGAPAAPTDPADPRLAWIVAAAALSAAIVAAASFLPAQRLWGVNHLAFVPPVARLAAIALLAISFLPWVARPLYRSGIRTFDAIARSPRSVASRLVILAIAAASVPAFWAARSSTLLLGDGQLLVRSFEAAEEGHDKVIMRSAHAIATEEKIAPGTTLMYYGATQAATDVFKKTPLRGMRMLNCILGGVVVLLVGLIATAGFAGGEVRLWLVILALFSCSIELFFGYIENYTAPTLFLSVYVIIALRALHGRGNAWLGAIPLAMAVYAHVQSILFVPSFLYLVLWTSAPSRRASLLRHWTPVFAAIAVMGVIVAPALPRMRKFYVPVGFQNDAYALFSPHHLADIANEVMMLLPILPVVAVLAWLGRRAQKGGRAAWRDPKSLKTPATWFAHPVEWQFTTTLLVPCALYILFFHPAIGMARDWDLFTMSTIAIVPWVLLVLNRYLRVTGIASDAAARFALPALTVMVVTGAAWVGVNASVVHTIDRFQRILTYDRTHASYAWENLAILQHDRGELQQAIATMRIASDHSHNPRQYVRLAVYLEESGKIEEAKQVLDRVLERHPDFGKARFRLLLFLEKQGDWKRIYDVARDGVKYNPDDAIYHFFYGEALIRAGQVEQGLAVFRACSQMNLPASAKQHIAETLRAYANVKPSPR